MTANTIMNTKRNIYKDAEHPFAQYIRIIGKGKTGARSLTYDEAYQAFSMILKNEVLDVQLGAFLMLLRVKEESVDELAGFVQATRDQLNFQPLDVDLDWSSYAGKRKHYPWFLLAALTLAKHGYKIVMHGAQRGYKKRVRGTEVDVMMQPKIKFEIVVSSEEWEKATIDAIQKAAFTGEVGDGKIFSYEIRTATKIRTRESGADALN